MAELTVPAAIKALGAECHVAGDTIRVVVPEESQEAVLETLRRERMRLISVTPVRTSLEDYFIAQLRISQEPEIRQSLVSSHLRTNRLRRRGMADESPHFLHCDEHIPRGSPRSGAL